MPMIDLTDAELEAVAAALRRTIANDRYPLSPRLLPLRAALAKLAPTVTPAPTAERPPLPGAARTRGARVRR